MKQELDVIVSLVFVSALCNTNWCMFMSILDNAMPQMAT